MKNIFVKIGIFLGNMLQIILKAGFALILFVGAWFFLTPYFRVDRNLEGDLYRNLPKDSIDVLALGSSHMQYAFNPAIFYTETGYYSYVMGSPCQPLSMSYSLLQECLKTQHPEVVIVDVFTLLPQSETCYADGMYYKAMEEMTGTTRIEAGFGVPNEEVRLHYQFDLLMNHDNWKNIPLDGLKEHVDSTKPARGVNYDLGYVSMLPENPRYAPLITYEVTEEVELLDSEKSELKQIADLCDANGIRLIYIKTPYIIDQNCTNKLAAIWSYLDEINVDYVDYIARAEELNWFVDMDGDTWHNNAWGAEIVTRDLAEYVREAKMVKHHRKNDEMASLLEGLRKNTAYLLMNDMNVNVYRLLDTSKMYPSLLLCRYTGGLWTTLGEVENELLNEAGLEFHFIEDYDSDYYAIVKEGKLLVSSDEPLEYVVNGHNIVINSEHILIDGNEVCQSGEMDLVFAGEDFEWINAIPIDYVTRWFWKNGCDGFTCE